MELIARVSVACIAGATGFGLVDWVLVWIVAAAVFLMGYSIGQAFGYSRGYDRGTHEERERARAFMERASVLMFRAQRAAAETQQRARSSRAIEPSNGEVPREVRVIDNEKECL